MGENVDAIVLSLDRLDDGSFDQFENLPTQRIKCSVFVVGAIDLNVPKELREEDGCD